MIPIPLTIGGAGTPSVVYSYSIPSSGGYDGAGNVLAYTDSVTGTWSMTTSSGSSGYDSLNRLAGAHATSGPYNGLQAAWSYDSFGNRTGESFSNAGNATAPIPGNTSATYNGYNQVATTASGFPPSYDAAGNMTCDSFNPSPSPGQCVGQNQYLYDAEGRVWGNLGTDGKPGNLGTDWLFPTLSTYISSSSRMGFRRLIQESEEPVIQVEATFKPGISS